MGLGKVQVRTLLGHFGTRLGIGFHLDPCEVRSMFRATCRGLHNFSLG